MIAAMKNGTKAQRLATKSACWFKTYLKFGATLQRGYAGYVGICRVQGLGFRGFLQLGVLFPGVPMIKTKVFWAPSRFSPIWGH